MAYTAKVYYVQYTMDSLNSTVSNDFITNWEKYIDISLKTHRWATDMKYSLAGRHWGNVN
jgi:hypothetical protein